MEFGFDYWRFPLSFRAGSFSFCISCRYVPVLFSVSACMAINIPARRPGLVHMVTLI